MLKKFLVGVILGYLGWVVTAGLLSNQLYFYLASLPRLVSRASTPVLIFAIVSGVLFALITTYIGNRLNVYLSASIFAIGMLIISVSLFLSDFTKINAGSLWLTEVVVMLILYVLGSKFVARSVIRSSSPTPSNFSGRRFGTGLAIGTVVFYLLLNFYSIGSNTIFIAVYVICAVIFAILVGLWPVENRTQTSSPEIPTTSTVTLTPTFAPIFPQQTYLTNLTVITLWSLFNLFILGFTSGFDRPPIWMTVYPMVVVIAFFLWLIWSKRKWNKYLHTALTFCYLYLASVGLTIWSVNGPSSDAMSVGLGWIFLFLPITYLLTLLFIIFFSIGLSRKD